MPRNSFSRWAVFIAIVAVLCLGVSDSAFAQSMFGGGGATTQGGGGQSGRQTTGGTGTARSNSAPGFSSQFGGANQFGQSGGIANALQGQGGGVAGGQAQTGAITPQFNTQMGELSATVGQGAFVGRSDTAGTFVGNRLAGQQGIQATDVRGGGGFGGGQFGGGQVSGRGQGGFGQNGFGNASQRVVRHSLRIAFDHPAPESSAIETRLDAQFEKFRTSRPELQGVEIQIGGSQEVVLRGSVQNENDKKLAATLARLEPGVRTVRNELTVESN